MATKMEMFREMTQAMREERENSSNANYRNDETFWYGSKLNNTKKGRVETMLRYYREERQKILDGARPFVNHYGHEITDELKSLIKLEHVVLQMM